MEKDKYICYINIIKIAEEKENENNKKKIVTILLYLPFILITFLLIISLNGSGKVSYCLILGELVGFVVLGFGICIWSVLSSKENYLSELKKLVDSSGDFEKIEEELKKINDKRKRKKLKLELQKRISKKQKILQLSETGTKILAIVTLVVTIAEKEQIKENLVIIAIIVIALIIITLVAFYFTFADDGLDEYTVSMLENDEKCLESAEKFESYRVLVEKNGDNITYDVKIKKVDESKG